MFTLRNFKLTLFILGCLVLIPVVGYAQDMGILDDPLFLVKALRDAVQQHNWPLVAVVALMVLIAILKKFGARFVPWFKTSEGGTVLAMLTAIGVGLGGALVSGTPITWGLIGGAVGLGFSAIGAWTGVRKLLRAVLMNKAVSTFLTAKVPWLMKALVFASGADVEAQVLKLTTDKFDAKTPPAAKDVASELDKPPSP